ncbi:MAG: FmdB family zinc ribbon protein [Dehalococcoidia bacterium]
MPIYEYYCQDCDGIFEAMRPMREASVAVPCPVCDRDGERIMPTSFMAFTFRDGYARRIPDRGTYWHLGTEVKRPNTGGVPANEHPELYRRRPPPQKTKGERAAEREQKVLERRERTVRKDYETRPGRRGDDKYYADVWRDYQEGQKKGEGRRVIQVRRSKT